MATYMYVSLQDDDKVLIFGVDSGTGNLTAKGEVPAVGGPSAAAVSPDRKVFYVGHRNSKEISSFQIDPNTGGLTLIGRMKGKRFICLAGEDRLIRDADPDGIADEPKRSGRKGSA